MQLSSTPASNRGQVTEREGSFPCFLAENKIRQNKILQGRCCGRRLSTVVKIKLCMAIHNCPLGEWVQVFGATIFEIDCVDKRYSYDWLMVALTTIDQS